MRRSAVRPATAAGASGRRLSALTALAIALVVAFVMAPEMLANASGRGFDGRRRLTEALQDAFVGYWRSGHRELSPEMRTVVDYWFRYHVAKAVIAAVLLVVLAALGVLIRRRFRTASTAQGAPGARGVRAATGARAARAVAFGTGMAAVSMLALATGVVLLANLQGAAAPFASLLPMLRERSTNPALADTLARAKHILTGTRTDGRPAPPALDVMVGDFARYHAALAVMAGIVAVLLVGMGAASWIRFARLRLSTGRQTWASAWFGLASIAVSLIVALVGVANTATAVHPVPAFSAFLDGGW